MPKIPQIAFFESSDLFRRSFQKYLDSHLDLKVAVCENKLTDLHHMILAAKAEVIILDLTKNDERNLAVFHELKRRANKLPVIILSESENIKQNFLLSNYYGASAFFSKDSANPDFLIKTIRTVANENPKEMIVEEAFRTSFIVDWFKEEEHEYHFTKKEKEVLGHIFEGKISTEIAKEMNLSLRTIESHRKNIIERSGSKNTVGALIKALKWGHLFVE